MKRLTRDYTIPCDQRYRVFDPAITIESGETIIVETVNHMTPVVRNEDDLHPHGSPEYCEREETGPIYVRGARPGDMLAIRIENIRLVGLPHAHGSGPHCDRFPQRPYGNQGLLRPGCHDHDFKSRAWGPHHPEHRKQRTCCGGMGV